MNHDRTALIAAGCIGAALILLVFGALRLLGELPPVLN